MIINIFFTHETHNPAPCPEQMYKCTFPKWIFSNKNVSISIKISLKFVPTGPINNVPAFGSENTLAPARPQAFVWNNAG